MIIKDTDKLIEMWSNDSKINQFDLSQSSLETGSLHAKYAGILSTHSMISKSIEKKYKQLKHVKWQYYAGELNTKEDLAKYGLEPLRRRILKTDIPQYIEADDELLELLLKKSFHDEIVDFCKYVIRELNNRTWQIKSAIEWNKYQAGG